MSPVSNWKQAATWARLLSDAELVSNLESLRGERSAIARCLFYEGHPECRCEENAAVFHRLDARFDWVRLEILSREGMTAHAKMARIAEAQARQEVAL